MAELDQFYGPNAGYVLDLLEQYQRDPTRADAAALAGLRPDAALAPSVAAVEPDISAAASAAALAQSIRFYGYLGATLDPLGTPPPGDPQLEAATHHLSDADLRALPASVVGGPLGARLRTSSAYEAIGRLRALYCGTSGFDFAHIADPERTRLAARGHRIRALSATGRTGRRARAARSVDRGVRLRALPAASLPGPDAILGRGPGHADPDARRADRRSRPTRHADDRARAWPIAAGSTCWRTCWASPTRRSWPSSKARIPGQAGSAADRTDEGWTGDVKYHAGARRVPDPRRRRGPRHRDGRPGSEPEPPGVRRSGGPGHGAGRRRRSTGPGRASTGRGRDARAC